MRSCYFSGRNDAPQDGERNDVKDSEDVTNPENENEERRVSCVGAVG